MINQTMKEGFAQKPLQGLGLQILTSLLPCRKECHSSKEIRERLEPKQKGKQAPKPTRKSAIQWFFKEDK